MTSPGATVKETPVRAGRVGRASGCNIARQPDKAGEKYFSKFSTKRMFFTATRPYTRTGREESSAPIAEPLDTQPSVKLLASLYTGQTWPLARIILVSSRGVRGALLLLSAPDGGSLMR